MLVFQCYLDDSGTSSDEPVISMAGFIAHADIWSALEGTLDEALNNYEVPILHAKEFEQTKGHFKSWKIIKKRSFANEIFAKTNGQIRLGISISVRKRAFKKRKQETGRVPTMSAYGVCFSALLVQLLNAFGPLSRDIEKDGLSVFVESGNNNNDELNQFFRDRRRDPIFKGALRDISFIPKDECRAIQIADFFAYYSRRHATRADRFNGKLALPIGPYFEAINNNVPLFAHVITDPFGGTSDYPFVNAKP